MKASEIIGKLFEYGVERDYSAGCDNCISGSPEAEVTKVAVAMFPTVDVIKKAHSWGADLLVVHEPTYFNHMDAHTDEKIESEKRALVESTGMTIYRYHDHPHYAENDMIAVGELRKLALDGEIIYTDIFDDVRIKLNQPLTAVELASLIESRLGIKHVRICGARDIPCTNVSAMFGAPGGGIFTEIKREETEILICGETVEWNICEYVRDASQLGYKKSLLVLGHVGSERAGMEYITDLLKQHFPELEIEYFECGEVYTYTD